MRCFLDIEASSLNVDGHPIEVGWCDEDGIGEAHLIRPPPHWTDWSAASQSVHGISRGQLAAEGRSVEHVARRALAMLSQAEAVYSDAPAFDGKWLEILFDAAGFAPPPKLLDVVEAYAVACRPLLDVLGPDEAVRTARQLIAAAGHLEAGRVRPRHRAFDDAIGLWRTWNEVRRQVRMVRGDD